MKVHMTEKKHWVNDTRRYHHGGIMITRSLGNWGVIYFNGKIKIYKLLKGI